MAFELSLYTYRFGSKAEWLSIDFRLRTGEAESAGFVPE
jgi:hypothetical protein